MPVQGLVPRTRRLCRAVLVRTAVLAMAAGALVGLQHQQATELGQAEPVAVTSNQIAVPPAPMGWASWNTFVANIDYNVIKAQVDAFVAAGLAGGQVQVHQHRRGLVAGHPRQRRQHHRRHR